jgi:hypothetical protein
VEEKVIATPETTALPDVSAVAVIVTESLLSLLTLAAVVDIAIAAALVLTVVVAALGPLAPQPTSPANKPAVTTNIKTVNNLAEFE